MGWCSSHSDVVVVVSKSSQNSPKQCLLIFLISIPCVFCLYIMVKRCYYDLSVLSMSVMDLKKKIGCRVGGWGGGVSSIQFYLDLWNFFNFAKPLTNHK